MTTPPKNTRTPLYPDAPTADADLSPEERQHYQKVWERAARTLEDALGAALSEGETRLLRDALDAARQAGALGTPPEIVTPTFQPQRERELTQENARLQADLDFQREIGRIHPPRPRAHLHRHFIKQIALPERYGLHLSMTEMEALQAQIPGRPPTVIVRGAAGVTLNIQGHEVLCLLNACAEDGSPTLTTVYTPQMLRGTTNDIV